MILSIMRGLGDKLSTASGVTAIVSTRIYAGQAPQNAPLPYIDMNIQAGGDDNASPVDSLDVLVAVKCVAGNMAMATAAGCADAIRAALHNATLTLEAPWTAYDCQHETAFMYADNEERQGYQYAGGVYRVRAYKSS